MSNLFYFPTRLVFSSDSTADLVQELRGDSLPRVIFLTDTGVVDAGLAAPFLQALPAAGIVTESYSQIPGNPNVQDMLPAFEAAQKMSATYVVALGGGSTIDTAKAVGVLLAHPGMDWEDLQW